MVLKYFIRAIIVLLFIQVVNSFNICPFWGAVLYVKEDQYTLISDKGQQGLTSAVFLEQLLQFKLGHSYKTI